MASKDREQIRRLREEANALRKQEEAKKRRQRMVAQIGTVIGALVVVSIIVVFAIMAPQWFGNRNTPGTQGTVEVASAEGSGVEVPIVVNGDAITVGKADAPHTIDYYLDFSCPHCLGYHNEMGPTWNALVAEGEVKINYHFIRFVHDYGREAGSALVAVVQKQPELFYTAVDSLFAVPAQTQTTWTASDYAVHMEGIGVTDPEVLTAIRDGDYRWWIMDRTNAARSAKVKGTPSVAIDGELQQNLPMPDTIDALLSGETPAATDAPATDDPDTDAPAPSESDASKPTDGE